MARFTILALALTSVGALAAAAKTHAPETSAELASAFSMVRSGDTIRLKSPMYNIDEQLSMFKVFGVKVEGARGGSTIAANRKTRILYLSRVQGVSFKAISFANGRVDTDSQLNASGAGALISQSQDITFDGECTFVNNIASGPGGGVAVFDSTRISFDGVTFTGNSAESGGGLYISDGVATTVANSQFVGNSASLGGGGLHVHGGEDSSLMSSSFTANKAQSVGPAVLLMDTAGFRIGGSVFESNLLQGGDAPGATPIYVVDSDVIYAADDKAEQTVETTCGEASAVSGARVSKKRSVQDMPDDERVDVRTHDDVDAERLGGSVDEPTDALGVATVRIFAVELEGLPESMGDGTKVRVRAIGVFGSAEVTGATNGSTNASFPCQLEPKISELERDIVLEVWAMQSGRKPALLGKAQAPIGNNTSGQDKYLLEGVKKIRFAYVTISWYLEPASDADALKLSSSFDAASTRGSGRVPIVGVVCAAMLAILAVVAAAKEYAGHGARGGTMQ